MEVDKSKLMKLVTKQYPIDKDNYETFEDITLQFGKHEVVITQEDMKAYFKGGKNEVRDTNTAN